MPADRSIIGVYKAAKELERIVELKDRRYKFKLYKKCFTGYAAVQAMIQSGMCNSIQEAVETGEQMLQAGYIAPVGDQNEFKVEPSFYTFVKEKRILRQETESSIHRLAVSLTGGYVMNLEGEMLVKVIEQSLKGLDIVKSRLHTTRKRIVQLGGGYMTISENDEKLKIVPLSTIVSMEYEKLNSRDFSFTCVEDGIESTFIFRNSTSADLWVRHLVIEVLNAAQVIENSITLLLRNEKTDQLVPEKFEDLLKRSVILWEVLNFPCERKGIAVSAQDAQKRLEQWLTFTRPNGELKGPLNDNVTDEQMIAIKAVMIKAQETRDKPIETKSEKDTEIVDAKEVEALNEEVLLQETLTDYSDPEEHTALDEIRDQTEELLFNLLQSDEQNIAGVLEREMEWASMEMRKHRRRKHEDGEFSINRVSSTGSYQRGTTQGSYREGTRRASHRRAAGSRFGTAKGSFKTGIGRGFGSRRTKAEEHAKQVRARHTKRKKSRGTYVPGETNSFKSLINQNL